jgi:hypothetical protein
MIDAVAVGKVFMALMGCWAMGYGIGASVAWVRRIRDVA